MVCNTKTLAVVTAVYGGFDMIPPVPVGFDDAVLVSNVPISSGWRNVVRPLPLPHRLAAKFPKFRPDLFTKCESSVWFDASGRDNNNWLAGASRELLATADLGVFKHPTRQCIYHEAECCKNWPKYRDWPIDEQIQAYRNRGYPVDNGLWACGVIMRNHTKQNKLLGDRWLFENVFFSLHDQLSFPFILNEMNIHCTPIPGNIWGGPIEFVEHSTKEIDPIARRIFNRIKHLSKKYFIG